MLTSLLRSQITVVWLCLTIATAASWLIGAGHGMPDKYAGIAVLLIAFAKVRLVGRYFMELRDAPIAVAAIFEGWVALVTITLIGFLLLT